MAGRGTVVVVGLGRFGAAVALGLARRGTQPRAYQAAAKPGLPKDIHTRTDAAHQTAQLLGSRWQWRILYSGSDFTVTVATISPQIAARLTCTDLALPPQDTVIVASPAGLVHGGDL